MTGRLVFVMFLALTGCETSNAPDTQEINFSEFKVVVDPETGCQYFQGYGGRFLHIRLGKDGKPMCGDTADLARRFPE